MLAWNSLSSSYLVISQVYCLCLYPIFFCPSSSFSIPSGIPMPWVLDTLLLSHRPLMFCSPFFSPFSLLFTFGILLLWFWFTDFSPLSHSFCYWAHPASFKFLLSFSVKIGSRRMMDKEEHFRRRRWGPQKKKKNKGQGNSSHPWWKKFSELQVSSSS